MGFRRDMITGLKWSSVGSIGLSIFQLLQISILTRFLPKEVFGLVALAVMVVGFTNIFVEMGLTSAIFHKQDATQKEYSSLYWFNLILSVILYLTLFLLAKPIALFYNEFELIDIIRVLGLNIIITTIGNQHKVLLQKKLEFDIVAKVDLFSFFIGLIMAVFLAWKGFGVYSLVFSTLTKSFISSATLLYIRLKHDPILIHFSINETMPFLKVGGFSFGGNFLDFFSREIDIIIIGKFLDSKFLGVYSLAKQISLKVYSLMMPIIFNVFNPMLSTLNKEKERMEEYFLKIVYGVTNITFPIYAIVILAASEILVILYGASYSEGTVTLIAMTYFYASFTIVKPSGSLQIATGRTDIGFYWTIFRNIITIIVLLLAVTFFEAKSIPVFLAGLSIFLVFYLWRIQIKRISSITFKRYILQFIYPLISLFTTLVLKLFLLDKIITVNNPFFSAFLKISVGLFLYFVLIINFDKKRILNIYKVNLQKK